MRKVGLIVVAAMMLPAGSAQAEPLAPFQFRELSTASTKTAIRKLVWSCGKSSFGTEEECFLRLDLLGVVAGQPILFGRIGFNQNKFAAMDLTLNSGSFDTVADAFATKYGQACQSSVPIVRTRLGVELKNDTKTWCFSDGELTINRFAAKTTDMKIRFYDNKMAAYKKAKPAIDF